MGILRVTGSTRLQNLAFFSAYSSENCTKLRCVDHAQVMQDCFIPGSLTTDKHLERKGYLEWRHA
eukprot:1154161-Pelagomonas_calceolata.AAC.6